MVEYDCLYDKIIPLHFEGASMDFREQLFMAVDNNDVNKVDEMLASITPKDPDFIDVLFAMQRACEQQNLQVVHQPPPRHRIFL